jgi:hypothetical protein
VYLGCCGDDLRIKGLLSFEKQIRIRPGATVVFSGMPSDLNRFFVLG